jgi:hypothetical protein
MRFCSRACLDQRNAPAAATPDRSRPMTHAVAVSELAIAETEAQHYFELTRRYNVSCAEPEFMETQHTYLGVWQKLDGLRSYVAARGADIGVYDGERQRFDVDPDRWEANPVDDSVRGTASFQAQNVAMLLAAVAEMRRLLDGLGPE